MKKLTVIVCSIALLIACANSEKPEYGLGDSQLQALQSGDRNTYIVTSASAISSKSETYTETFSAKPVFAPDNNTIDTFVDSFTQSGNLILPFISRILGYDEEGNLLLYGITRSGENYWVMENDVNTYGEILLPKDLSGITENINITSALKFCENQICNTQGQINIVIQPEGIESASTGYAEFETYKFSIYWDINLFDTENANNSVNQTLRQAGSRQWIHPALGVVKFVYEVFNDTQSDTIIGYLADTNISIDSQFKE